MSVEPAPTTTLRTRESTSCPHPAPAQSNVPSPRSQGAPTAYAHATARTLYVHANGIQFAYRRFGPKTGVPLVFMQHFRGGMDHWDPAVTDGLAYSRPIILFDNAGVASSSGSTPNRIEAMAEHAADFLQALGHSQVDLLETLDRRLHRTDNGRPMPLADTAPHTRGNRAARRRTVVRTQNCPIPSVSTDQNTGETGLEAFLHLFFAPSEASQAAGRALGPASYPYG